MPIGCDSIKKYDRFRANEEDRDTFAVQRRLDENAIKIDNVDALRVTLRPESPNEVNSLEILERVGILRLPNAARSAESPEHLPLLFHLAFHYLPAKRST